MKVPRSVCAAGFILTAGAIAWGVLSDAHEARLQELLTSIEGAENEVPYLGTRLMGGAEPVRLRILSKDGHRRVDFLGFERPSKTSARPSAPRHPLAGGLPLVLRPGRDQWMRKVKDAALAVRNYDISVTGSEMIAGRVCQVIEVRSRHSDRPSYRLAADAQNRFPLRYEVFSGGESVFETHFSEIRFNPPVPAPALEQHRRPTWLKVSQRTVTPEELGRNTGFPVLRPAWLPEGFELRGSEIISVRAEISRELRETLAPFLPFPLPKLEVGVVHLTYTDGLAAIAVVECSASSELWQSLRMFIPGTPSKIAGSRVVARRFSDRSGSAYLLEVGDTVVLVAGNVEPGSMECMIRTLERRE